jgi:trehalose synthase
MNRLVEIPLRPRPLGRLEPVVTPAGWSRLQADLEAARPLLAERRIWLVNSTAVGGGVAEMLRSLAPYACGAGFDVRWVVITGSPAFFAVTKELHNQLHGHARKALDADARAIYESTLVRSGAELASRIGPGDVVVLHDPQTAGLAQPLRSAGATVIWRSHVGTDDANSVTQCAWDFLMPHLRAADACVFTRDRFVPPELRTERVRKVAPSIDPLSTKNDHMPPHTVAAILEHVGIVRTRNEPRTAPRFTPRDREPQLVRRRAEVLRYGAAPRLGVDPIVLQLSRWDRLKDPVGVMRAFAKHVLSDLDVHLVIAGPPPGAIADDPEASDVFEETVRAWRALPHGKRSRVQLVQLPNDDAEENAAIVNALQRASSVVVKKSLQEGFGLGVTEAMWKRLPVVASRVGGIQEQIEHCRSGLLVDDPLDLESFGAAVGELLVDRGEAGRLGAAAKERVREHFLPDRHLAEWVEFAAGEVLTRENGTLQAQSGPRASPPVSA